MTRCTVSWLPKAEADVSEAYAFLSKVNRSAANDMVDAVQAAADRLESLPAAGSPSDIGLGFRELAVPFGAAGYVLLYRLDESETRAWVVAVKHYREAGFIL